MVLNWFALDEAHVFPGDLPPAALEFNGFILKADIFV